MVLLWCVLACALTVAHAQSNYGSQANNIEYQGEGLPEQTILDGKVSIHVLLLGEGFFLIIFIRISFSFFPS